MTLNYYGHSVRYNYLGQLLGVQRPFGAPFSNIRALGKEHFHVLYQQGTLPELYEHLQQGTPCIVSVETGELPYWNLRSRHVVLLVGMDSKNVYLNDPEFSDAPIRSPIGDFDLAWLAQEERYAVLTPR